MMDIREDHELTDEEMVRRQKAMNNYNAELEIEIESTAGPTELEKARYAKLREEQGKEPKVIPGQKTKEAKNQLLLGHLVEASLSMINLLETSEGSKMFFNIDVPLSDGRKFSMCLKGE